MVAVTNAEIITYLSNGYKIEEIVIETGINRRTLESRLMKLKKQSLSKTVPHLVANYLRKQLIA